MKNHTVDRAVRAARDRLDTAWSQSQETQPTLLHDAFETLRLAVDDLADAIEALHEAAAVEKKP